MVHLYPAPSIMHDKGFLFSCAGYRCHAQEPKAVTGWKRHGIALGSFLGELNVMWLFIAAQSLIPRLDTTLDPIHGFGDLAAMAFIRIKSRPVPCLAVSTNWFDEFCSCEADCACTCMYRPGVTFIPSFMFHIIPSDPIVASIAASDP